MTIRELAEKIADGLGWNIPNSDRKGAVQITVKLIEQYGAELTDLRQVPTMPSLGPLKQIIAAMEADIKDEAAGQPDFQASLDKYANQLKKLIMLKHYTADVSGPAKCPKCKQPKLKFVISAISNDLRIGCALGVALQCTQNGCGVFHDLCNTPNNMLQFFDEQKKDDLSNSGKAFIEINQMLGTLRIFEDWPSLIKALHERLKDDGTVKVKKRAWESQNIAFNELSMIFKFAQDSKTITEDSWKNLVRHIASMTSEAVNEKIVNLQGFETPKQTFAKLAPEVPPWSADKSKYVIDRLKDLQRNSVSQVTSNIFIFEELFPLLIMLAEDLSEFKKKLDRLPGKNLPF